VAELKELATDALVAQGGLSFASRTTRSLISGDAHTAQVAETLELAEEVQRHPPCSDLHEDAAT
jgi:hypothetical protein